MKIFSIYLDTWRLHSQPCWAGYIPLFLIFFFFFLFLDLLALHPSHKKTWQTVNLSFGCLHWTVQTESANCAESFSLRLPHGKMLTITLLFISFAYQCQAVYSATRAPYVAQMTHFKSPYFNLCTVSLPLAVCTATTFGAVTNGKLSLDHMMCRVVEFRVAKVCTAAEAGQWPVKNILFKI